VPPRKKSHKGSLTDQLKIISTTNLGKEIESQLKERQPPFHTRSFKVVNLKEGVKKVTRERIKCRNS
jgi:hypothetical protein